MINAKTVTVIDILEKSVKYAVPSNQRNFEWKKYNAKEFLEDIRSGSAFLGTAVFDISEEKENNTRMIVDGQQRMTTIFIFLSACKHQALETNNLRQAESIQELLTFKNRATGDSTQSKLETSPSVKAVFDQTIVNYEWDGKNFNFKDKKRQVNKIKPIYDEFRKELKDYGRDEIADILEKLFDSTFVQILIEDKQEAFDIFERTNARGMELNAADLLKNFLFAKKPSEELEELWDNIVENSSGNLIRMIKYFYVSEHGLVQKKDLFRKLKAFSDRIGIDKFLEDLVDFSSIYSMVASGGYQSVVDFGKDNEIDEFRKEYRAKALNRSFDAINLFGISQVYPLIIKTLRAIYKVSDKSKRDNLSKNYVNFVGFLEKYHFINSAVSQIPGNDVESFYGKKCEMVLVGSAQIDTFMKEIAEEMTKEKLVEKEYFLKKFENIDYQSDSHLVYYIFDRLNNIGSNETSYGEIYNSDKKLLKRSYNIEHLISKSSNNYNFSEEDLVKIEDIKDNIGNLLVISQNTNSGLGDKHIVEKIKILEEKPDALVSREIKHLTSDWFDLKWEKFEDLAVNIERRSALLAERIFKSFRDNIKTNKF